MEVNNLIPWSEVVAMKQESDKALLVTIEHYRVIAENESVSQPSRTEAAKLMKQYQRIYLGLHSGV